MPDPTLPYATKPAPLSGLTITTAEDEVALTKAQPRGLLLGSLITLTVTQTALWTMLLYAAVKIIDVRKSFGTSAVLWYVIAILAIPALPAVLWTIMTAVGWLRYWRVGPIALQIRVTRDGLSISRPGVLRAVSISHFAPDAVRGVELRPVRGSLTRKPLCEIIVQMRRRFPLTVRTAEPIDGAPRAFVDGAKRLLNLHR